jgi:hypothetical protein
MKTSVIKRKGKIACVAYAMMITLITGFLLVKHCLLLYRVAHANMLIEHFDDQRSKALQSDTEEAIRLLASVLHFYPSGTVQKADSPLDHMVESARASTARAIVAHLRKISRVDHGEDPEKWIQAFEEKAGSG